jgi:large subunit ribosomal protein L10
MDRTQKESLVSGIRERIDRAPVMYLTDFTGLSVKQMTELRRTLKRSGAEYVVVKNRLAARAVAEAEGMPDLGESLTGPTGLVFGYDDVVGAAKVLSDFAKAHDSKPAFKLGVMDRKLLDPSQIDRLAQLPPREVLLAQLAGAFEAPMAQLAAALGAKLQEMVGLLDALREQRAKAG